MERTLSYRCLLQLILNSIGIAVFSIIIAGCAAQQTEVKQILGPEESLRAAAEQYWKLRMADKYEETYKMEDRTALPPFVQYRDQVMAMKKITILKYEVKDVIVDDNAGTVRLDFFTILPPLANPFKQPLYDKWVFREGAWWHVLPPLD